MVAADTNIWARAYLNDDPVQAKKARVAIEKACTNGGLLVPLVVLAELFWVLRRKWEKERVLNTLEHLLNTEGVIVESPALAIKALEESRVGASGFADRLIAEICFDAGATEIITFDKVFGRLPRARLLK
jgi:predicted nucleic-acid-binding protein